MADSNRASGVGGPGPAAPPKGPGGGAYASFGLQFVVALLFFLWLGQWVDRRLGTAPVFLLIGVFAGAGGSFYAMYRKLMAAQERDEQAAREAKRAAADDAARDTGRDAAHRRDLDGRS